DAAQAILNLENLHRAIGKTADEIGTRYIPRAEELNDRLADIGANAFGELAGAAAEGKNAFEAFFNALRRGIAEFLIEIGKAIIKQAMFIALSGAGGSGGLGGWIAGGIMSLFRHQGGLVSDVAGGTRKMVNPAIFAGAHYYHG